ncbi:unnamed protein product [Trichobilharzia regenti]|nr:unnamed protein product [Trichobilharzia regenti]
MMSNLKITSTTIPTTTNNNNKSPLFNHDELKQHSTITENLGTTRDDITLSNSHQINSLSSIKPTDNNDGGSIKRTVSFNESISIPTVSQCQNQQIKTQRTASQSRKQASKMRSAEKSQEVSSSILNSNNNNNNNVTNVIASTTATNISSNSSLFRVAQWINSITPLYSTDQSVQCFNNNNNSNDVHYSVYSTTMAGATPATTVVITTPSTLNDSAIGSLKCTKQNGLSKNQSCMAKICENKQTFPLYSSSPVVPPPSLLSSHNDTTPLGYPFYSMTSDGICQIPQSHSTPVFISPQETAISPSNHNNNCNNNNNNNNNSHPPYTNQPTSPPSANVSDLYTHQLTTDNNLVGTRNYEAGERLDGLRNQMALANPHNSPAYYPYYQYYYYHYQNQQCDPDQICFNNNNNNSTDEMTPKQAFYPPTSLCQPDQLTQIKLAHNLNIGQIHENCNPNEPNAYHNNNEEEEEHGGEAMDRPSEKLKMKLSLKFLTLPLFRNFRLRRKEKKRNSGKANRTTDKEDNKSSISVTRNGDVEQVEEDDDRSVKPSPILHSLSLPVKLTTFGYQPVEGNNNNNNTAKPNNLSCTDNCCHCEHSQYLRDHQQRQQRQLPSPPSIPAPPTPTLGPHSQTSFSPLHGYRHHSSISSRLPPNHHHHHHHHQTSRQFNSHLWSQHCTENVETPIINYCNKHLPHSYSLQNNGSFLNQRNDVNFSLSNSPSTGFNAASGKLSASVCRSTRRSMHITGSGGGGGCGGGPSSSGYESMRTGASELSLSHQDSASDCSGQCKDILLSRRSSLDGYRQRCNSHHHQHHQHQHHSHHLHVQSHSSSHQSQQYDHRSSYQQNNQQHLMINNQS